MRELLAGGRKLVTVGDVVTTNALRAGLRPWVAVVDKRAMRKPWPGLGQGQRPWGLRLRASNPPGMITAEAWAAIGEAVRRGDALVEVDGEEDLLALVAVLLAPEGTLVLYGQPGEGVVLVEVNERSRRLARAFLSRMRPVEG